MKTISFEGGYAGTISRNALLRDLMKCMTAN